VISHFIIEGPDGSGKDTLIRELLTLMPDHTLHERASTSIGGPVANLAEWVSADIGTIDQPPSIYNRHPLVSERIYAKYRRPPGYASLEFGHRGWVSAMQRRMSARSVMVLCLPPRDTVLDTVKRQGITAHMPGVYEHIGEIYDDYAEFTKPYWPGPIVRYDYTRMSPIEIAALLTAFLMLDKKDSR
jgi:hypothetical protein